MIRNIALGGAAALLIIGLPVAALAISRAEFTDTATSSQESYAQTEQIQDPAAAAQEQVQSQQRLQIHAETGMPTDDFEPTQTRQRLQQQTNDGQQAGHRGGQGGQGGQHGKNGAGHQGNSNDGECTNEGGPIGTSG